MSTVWKLPLHKQHPYQHDGCVTVPARYHTPLAWKQSPHMGMMACVGSTNPHYRNGPCEVPYNKRPNHEHPRASRSNPHGSNHLQLSCSRLLHGQPLVHSNMWASLRMASERLKWMQQKKTVAPVLTPSIVAGDMPSPPPSTSEGPTPVGVPSLLCPGEPSSPGALRFFLRGPALCSMLV